MRPPAIADNRGRVSWPLGPAKPGRRDLRRFHGVIGKLFVSESQSNPCAWPMTIGIRVNRDADLEADYFGAKIPVIFKVAGSNTASMGCPRPVSGIELG